MESAGVGGDAWRRTGVLTFDGNRKVKKKVTFYSIKQHLEEKYSPATFGYGSIVQLCVARNKRRRSAQNYKGVAKVTCRRARKGFDLKFNPDSHWSSALYRGLDHIQYMTGTDKMILNRDDLSVFWLDSMDTSNKAATLCIKCIFLDENTGKSKRIECIRVDSGHDEAPCFEEVQCFWTKRHFERPTHVQLVTSRHSGGSNLNCVELQNGCEVNVRIPSVSNVNQIQNFSGTPEDHLLLLFLYLCRIKSVHMGLKIVLPVERSVPDMKAEQVVDYFQNGQYQNLEKRPLSKIVKVEFQKEREKLLEEGHCERIAKAVLLKVSEVNMWINHLKLVQEHRREGAKRAAITGSKKTTKENQGNAATKTLTTNKKSKVLNLRLFRVN